MDNTKYIGMDVHKETILITALNSAGKLGMELVIETKAITIVKFVQELRGDLHVTLPQRAPPAVEHTGLFAWWHLERVNPLRDRAGNSLVCHISI